MTAMMYYMIIKDKPLEICKQSARIENPVTVEALLQAAMDRGNGGLEGVKSPVWSGTAPAEGGAAGSHGGRTHVGIAEVTTIPTQRTAPVDQQLAREIQWCDSGRQGQSPDRAAVEE
jgi:hypothetical protein